MMGFAWGKYRCYVVVVAFHVLDYWLLGGSVVPVPHMSVFGRLQNCRLILYQTDTEAWEFVNSVPAAIPLSLQHSER